jgi:multicomponent Na+:H+ antiporter subunit D
MTALVPHLPALQVVVPLIGAVLSAFIRRGTTAWAFALVVTWITPVIAIALLLRVLATGPISYPLGGWSPPVGIEYRVDVLNAFVLVLVTTVSAILIPAARRSVAHEIDGDKQAWFYTTYLLCLTGLLGITITGDAFNVFVFLEISSLATYVLIAMGRDRRALLAAYRYLIVGTIGATFYVIGIGLIYLVTGTLNIVDLAARLGPAAAETSRPVLAGLGFITVGVCLKLALFPLHFWLPSAYAHGPSFAATFLAATATKVAVYVLLRFFFTVFGPTVSFAALPIGKILLALSVAAMFVASLIAVFETNVKRLLAYSSVAQIGYITLGIAITNLNGLTGGIVHLINHAMIKAALFLSIACIAYRGCSVRIDDLAGIGRRMPLTMAAFAVAGASIVGVPGTAGFISKWYLAVGALDKGWWPLVVLILASSILAILYIGRIVEIAWLHEPTGRTLDAHDPPWSMLAPLVVLAAANIYFGLDTEWTADVARRAAQMLLGGLRG